MIVSDFVPKVYLQATGKIPTFTTGTTKWLKIVALANQLIQDWQDEKDVDWSSLYSPDYVIGTVTATNSFTLPAAIRKLSQQEGDVIRIVHTDGVTYTDYSTIPNDRGKDFANGMRTYQDNYIIQVGSALKFNRAFASTDPQFGGSITVPAYLYAGTIAADLDVIPVDIPAWLVYATAAAYVSTDVTRQNLVPRFEDKANEFMATMKANNDGAITKMYQPFNPMQLTNNGAFN